MKQIPYIQLIQKSFRRTKSILLPFSLKKWLLLIVIIFLAGHLGGGFNFNVPGGKEKRVFLSLISSQTVSATTVEPDSKMENFQQLQKIQEWFQEWRMDKARFYFWVAILGILLFLFFFFMCWINGRFQFVFLEALVKNQAQIAKPFFEFRNQGNSLFWWNVIMGGTGVFGTVGAFIILFTWMSKSSLTLQQAFEGWVSIFFGALFWVILALALFLIPLVIVNILAIDFVVPLMYQRKIGILRGWSVFRPSLQENWKEVLLYLVVKLILGLAAVLSATICILLLIAFLVVCAIGVFGAGFLLWKTVTVLRAFLAIAGFILGIFFFISALLTYAIVVMPIAVFFRAFSIYFLEVIWPEFRIFQRSP